MVTNQEIVFLTADMGINLVEKIQRDFPSRYLNVGIAEQNLIGVAAGLAQSGFKPFVYTISNFLTIRALEQIRNDIVLHKLPVTLVGTSTGFDNGPLGPTHHILEDWGILSAMPNLQIYCPSRFNSVETIFDRCLASNAPSYVRIPKGKGIDGELQRISNKQTLVLTYGSTSSFGIEYSLSNDYDYKIIETLKPLDLSIDIFNSKTTVIVIEDHFSEIGLYSQICQLVNSARLNVHVKSVAPKSYNLRVGFRFEDFLRDS